MCRGPLAQVLVSEVVWLTAYGLLKSFQKRLLDISFLSFKIFVTVLFHFTGLNYLGFVDLGSILHVLDIAADKQYQNLVFFPVFEHQALFFPPHRICGTCI